MRTAQMFTSDNNNSFTSVWHHKFETLKSIVQKKAPTNRSILSGGSGSTARGATNAKHAGVLQEAGISYDAPLNPVQVAAVRAERIAQKQKQAAEQQQQQQRLTATSSTATAATPSSPAVRTPTTAPQTTAAAPATTSAPQTAATTTTGGQQTLLLQASTSAVQGASTVKLNQLDVF